MPIEVYISNISEDVWGFIETLKEEEKYYEVEENAFLSDRDVLTLNPDFPNIIILPAELDPDFLEYYKELFNNNNVEVWVPKKHSGQTSVDIQTDTKLWQQLIVLGKEQKLILKSYSCSPQFSEMVSQLRAAGCIVETPESPPESALWTVNYFGSKSGIRETLEQIAHTHNHKRIAIGTVAHDIDGAIEAATTRYLEKGAVVIKTNKAHSGAGVVIIPPGKISNDESECREYFQNLFSKEKYWSKFPIVIEEFLDVDETVGGGNPNCEYRINPDGEVQLLYICGMRVTNNGIFKGVEVGNKIFSSKLTNTLLSHGEILGKIYSKAGYRGYFDVDCILTVSGELLITESNVRRTGGTHVYHAGVLLLGKNFSDKNYILSNNTHSLPENKHFTFSDLLMLLQPVLFTTEKKAGVVLASSNILKQQKLSYIIIGANKKEAYEIEAEMERLLLE